MAKPKKYSVVLSGHATSITLEPEFWEILQKIAREKGASVASLISYVDQERLQEADPANLSSALRVYILQTVLLFPSKLSL
ncbi:MAG TPA: ribbon-helix-helix domain-containing protein [Candidatus Nitrosotenuis sp.]|jgi:predicted DNA-binding ribbon-helix-helix protein|nr:ribbon-helix-helix domain-containing protein [Candidatus Nitrosotenuis sp.]